MSISENRRHRKRIMNKRKNYVSAWNGEAGHKVIAMTATTAKRCGCKMCSNARKVFGRPFSEIRQEQIWSGTE